eukprot:CAMPEP_0197652320 /NCGR_PEP_ID=MMETSP1338-20131121/34379_1 /TAXON_ID=43686 ORGANISM="Pelagodinium beii, Strain RCC1491" /NCGR_SAMPLE_ID=MMETSP1338 /ASSEMBLY_ACC=CAM_ASM_000754 /LENGTH=162 /DNA_ID=CAMNT_0043227171 /DNA_START=213 /DNA_END=697 /DNA_ORIENTATION=+
MKKALEAGVRPVSDLTLIKEHDRTLKFAENDAFVDEFLSYSRPMPTGGEYAIPPEDAKAILEEIYGKGSDIQYVDLGEDAYDEEPSQKDMNAEFQNLRRDYRRSSVAEEGKHQERTPVYVKPVGGTIRIRENLAREIAASIGPISVTGGAADNEFKEAYISG